MAWLKEKPCRVCKVHLGGGAHLEEICTHCPGHQKCGAMFGAENQVYSKEEVSQIASCYGQLQRASCSVGSSETISEYLIILPNNTKEANKSFGSVTQSCLTLRPHGLQYARFPCPSPTPGAYSNSCPSCQWCHPTISSSVIPFSSCLQSLPASGSFPMSQFFTSGGQSTGVWASASLTSLIHQSTNIYAAILRTRILYTSVFTKWVFFACMLSCVRFSVTLWTVARQAPLPWNSWGKNTEVGCPFLLQGIFLTQGSSPCLLYWQADSLPLRHYMGSTHSEYGGNRIVTEADFSINLPFHFNNLLLLK